MNNGAFRQAAASRRVWCSWLTGLALSAAALGAGAIYAQPVAGGAALDPCKTVSPGSGSVELVYDAAQRFLGSLSPSQRARVVMPFTQANAIRWSNFPPAIIPRAGVEYGELNQSQTRAANDLVRSVAGTCGFEAFDGNRAADAIGHTVIAYLGPGHHLISFTGTPSRIAPWMVMIGGHHLGFNFMFNGRDIGATPMLVGSDPARFRDSNGRMREPLASQSAALADVARAVEPFRDAKLPGVFTDLTRSVVSIGGAIDRIDKSKLMPPPPLLRPGVPSAPPEKYWESAMKTSQAVGGGSIAGTDLAYPIAYPAGTMGRGVLYARLDVRRQAVVRRAIAQFVSLSGKAMAEPILRLYLDPKALAATYIGFSGDPGLTKPNGYVRIDGPRIWIEMSVQSSLVDPRVVHFHALWRDKLSDYGGQFRQ